MRNEELKRKEDIVNRYKFSVYPPYDCCNILDLLRNHKIILNIYPSIGVRSDENIKINLIAIIPLENSNHSTEDIEDETISYYRLNITYSYDYANYEKERYPWIIKNISLGTILLDSFKINSNINFFDIFSKYR